MRNTGPDQDVDPAWQPLPTGAVASAYTTFDVGVTDTRITVSGELFNANPGQLVRVTLQRHDGTRFRTVLWKDVTVTAYGDYKGHVHQPGQHDDLQGHRALRRRCRQPRGEQDRDVRLLRDGRTSQDRPTR